jgi:hypothetical protein
MYAVLEGSINGVNIEKLPEGRHAMAGRGFRPALRHRCQGRSSGQHLLSSPSSCSSCSRRGSRARPRPSRLDRDPRHGCPRRDHRHPPATDKTARLLELVLPRYCGCSAGLHLIYTSVVEASALRIERSFQISVRKQVLRAAALTTVKAPFSDRIFRQMTGSGGRWRVSMGIFRKGAGTLGWAGDVTTQRRNLAVDQLQKQRQGNYRYKLKL